jgi:hypothetical protein
VWALLVSDTNLISASADGSIKVSAQRICGVLVLTQLQSVRCGTRQACRPPRCANTAPKCTVCRPSTAICCLVVATVRSRHAMLGELGCHTGTEMGLGVGHVPLGMQRDAERTHQHRLGDSVHAVECVLGQ